MGFQNSSDGPPHPFVAPASACILHRLLPWHHQARHHQLGGRGNPIDCGLFFGLTHARWGGACLCGLGVKQMKSRNLILLTSNDFNNCSIVLLPILLDERWIQKQRSVCKHPLPSWLHCCCLIIHHFYQPSDLFTSLWSVSVDGFKILVLSFQKEDILGTLIASWSRYFQRLMRVVVQNFSYQHCLYWGRSSKTLCFPRESPMWSI